MPAADHPLLVDFSPEVKEKFERVIKEMKMPDFGQVQPLPAAGQSHADAEAEEEKG